MKRHRAATIPLLWIILGAWMYIFWTENVVIIRTGPTPGLFVHSPGSRIGRQFAVFSEPSGHYVLGYWDNRSKYRCDYALAFDPATWSLDCQNRTNNWTVIKP